MKDLTRYPEEEDSVIMREVLIHEYYEKIDGEVYWYWKLIHEDEFRCYPAPLPEIPYYKMTIDDNGRFI
jgi:hypothetical protein